MKAPLTFIAACTALSFAAISASAHDEQSQSSQQNADPAQQSSGQNSAWQKAQSQEFFRSSDIVGKNTQTSNGQKLGSVKEVVFNQQGEIFALVDIGNSRLAVVPWQAVTTQSAKGNQNLTLNTTQQALQSGPVVSKDQWGALNNPNFTQGVYSYYHLQPPSAMGGASTPGGTSQGQEQGQSQGQGSSEQQQKSSNQQQPQSGNQP